MVNNGVTFNQKGRKNFLHESDQSIHLMTTLINVDDDLKNGSFSETTILIPSELSDYPVSTSTVCRQNGSMRFFVISLMAIPILIQVFSQSIWGAIHESALLAFPNWTRRSISLLPIWGSVITAILIIPACVAINKCGLRLSLLCSCCFYTLGSAIRCMPSMYSCTLCLHLSAIFLSVGGVLMTPLIITMSALWFPKNERNMATGVCLAVRMLGSAATYVIGPYVVSVARDGLEKPFIMKIRIMQMLYTCLILNGLMTLLVYLFFPPRNHKHHHSSYYECDRSTDSRRNAKLVDAIKTLVTNRNALYLVLAFTLSSTMSVPWASLMPLNFHRLRAPPEYATQCSFYMIIHVFALNLAFSRLADQAPDYKKRIMLGCHFISTFCVFWLMMMFSFNTRLTFTVLECVILVAFPYTWGCQPLFYEMGAELMYPLPESFIAGYMTVMNNLFIDFVYLALYFFPHFDEYWLHIGMFVCSVLSLIFLCLVSDDTKIKRDRYSIVR